MSFFFRFTVRVASDSLSSRKTSRLARCAHPQAETKQITRPRGGQFLSEFSAILWRSTYGLRKTSRATVAAHTI